MIKIKLSTKLFYLFLPIIGGSLVGFLISGSIDYNNLNQPMFAPPKIAFPIAWSIIYVLMGIAYYIYRKNNDNDHTIKLYYTQLILNWLWSIIFFSLKLRLLSILWIIILVANVYILMKRFKIEEKTSYYLFIPYLIWLLFATYLNISIYLLN